ncbi:hypothetical protein P6P90_12145 [Ectobacillus antri]|uniref:DUF2325 domain-containing protein n=1 Tax=Ectobacillus antri TaxID=2486280 RepID=A0ABT6H667_9BACI|nr:hypothetical protein [Ectobacillus antri]MDG4657712.1 hypothetical protein [Ectobacillus antri]MDG5754719.1 hypothetical protein [Ectobacillus antri]
MFISKVKPDMKSLLYFFDNKHNFFTKVDVYFTHNDQQLKAVLLWPFRRGVFVPECFEVFYNGGWHPKKGQHFVHLYAEALTVNKQMHELVEKIKASEKAAKLQLERKFNTIVQQVAKQIEHNLNQHVPTVCKVSEDYLYINVTMCIGDIEETGRLEMNNYVHHHTNINEAVAQFAKEYTSKLLEQIPRRKQLHAVNSKPEPIYVTTVPTPNPLAQKDLGQQMLCVSVHCEGYCSTCNEIVIDSVDGNRQINLHHLSYYKGECIVNIVGDNVVCPTCHAVVPKDNVTIVDTNKNELVIKRKLSELTFMGTDKEEIGAIIRTVLYDYTEEMKSFWQAYCFVATQNWDVYSQELTVQELQWALKDHIEHLPNTKQGLLTEIQKLEEKDRQAVWQKANETIVRYYSDITVFGWDIPQAIKLIGQNRAAFIFSNLCMSQDLKEIRARKIGRYFMKYNEEIQRLETMINQQHKQIQELRQESGRLSNKLGQAYERISSLEQTQQTHKTQERNKSDILKIQQLKGLIEELKTEVVSLSSQISHIPEEEELILTEEVTKQEVISRGDVLRGKTILILGGYRDKQVQSKDNYTVITHTARTIDPAFYEALKQADIIIILTRYISHRAMWEAKEFAILEEKVVYYSTFTNVPAILDEVVSKVVDRSS